MTVECNLGDLEMGKEVSIQIGVELNPTVLQIMPVSPHPPSSAQLRSELGFPKPLCCFEITYDRTKRKTT